MSYHLTDADSLELSQRCILDLQQSDCMVGLISHRLGDVLVDSRANHDQQDAAGQYDQVLTFSLPGGVYLEATRFGN